MGRQGGAHTPRPAAATAAATAPDIIISPVLACGGAGGAGECGRASS